MPKLISQEGGKFPFYFDQWEGSADVPPVIIQALLVAPERKRRVKIPVRTPQKPQLTQIRQSRITVALDGTDPKFTYRPAESDHPDVGVRFDRQSAAESLASRGLDSRPTLATARSRKTTIPLFGLPPLEPTHRLINLNVPFETIAVALSQPPSEFKLNILTTGNGGLAFTASIEHYQTMLAQRLAAEIGTNPLAAQAKPSTAKTKPSRDLYPEIPWVA